MNTIKHYRFKNILFTQEELTFGEDGKVREILCRIAALTSPQAKVGDLLESIYTEGLAEELFAVILKPNNATIVHRLWNRFWSWRHKIRPEGRSVISHLRNSQVMEVLSDFFVLNTIWMNGFAGLAGVSVSGLTKIQAEKP